MRVKTSQEYSDYVTFYRLFPWGYDTAFLACLISNLTRGKNKEPFNVSDFMPADRIDLDPVEQTWQNLRALAAKGSADGKR